jgi:hypothetical protein
MDFDLKPRYAPTTTRVRKMTPRASKGNSGTPPPPLDEVEVVVARVLEAEMLDEELLDRVVDAVVLEETKVVCEEAVEVVVDEVDVVVVTVMLDHENLAVEKNTVP